MTVWLWLAVPVVCPSSDYPCAAWSGSSWLFWCDWMWLGGVCVREKGREWVIGTTCGIVCEGVGSLWLGRCNNSVCSRQGVWLCDSVTVCCRVQLGVLVNSMWFYLWIVWLWLCDHLRACGACVSAVVTECPLGKCVVVLMWPLRPRVLALLLWLWVTASCLSPWWSCDYVLGDWINIWGFFT